MIATVLTLIQLAGCLACYVLANIDGLPRWARVALYALMLVGVGVTYCEAVG